MPLRKNFVFLTNGERTRLASALNKVLASNFLPQIASQHSSNFNSGIHWGSAFLPWHRWFLQHLEVELQRVESPEVTIPYWDWTRPDSRSIDAEPWKSFFGGRSNTGGQFDLWPYNRAPADPQHVPLPVLLPLNANFSVVDRLNRNSFARFRELESSGGHGGGHNWVGGTMAGGSSPLDPLFWLHHANIDRLWAIWQRNHTGVSQYTTAPAAGDSVPAAMVPLNSPMIGGATPAQMLIHTNLGYSYDTDVRLEAAWETSGPAGAGHLVSGDPTVTDFYIRDSAADNGLPPSPVPHWESPDIWVRNEPPGPNEVPEDGHQPPIINRPNHVYVLVHNRGQAPNGPVSVEAYRCSPSTAMLWPTHFQSLGSLPLPNVIGQGGQARVGPFIWTPTATGHECLLAIVRTEAEDPGSLETVHGVTVPAGTAAPIDHSTLIRFDNNVGQRNVAPVLAAPGSSTSMGINIRGLERTGRHSIKIDASALPDDTVVLARFPNTVLDSGKSDMARSARSDRFTTLSLKGGKAGTVSDIELRANSSAVVTMTVDFSFDAKHLAQYPVRIEQHHQGGVIGAYTIDLTAIKELDDYFFGNPRTFETHITTCPLWPRINRRRLIAFEQLSDATARGYNGCRFCLPEADTG